MGKSHSGTEIHLGLGLGFHEIGEKTNITERFRESLCTWRGSYTYYCHSMDKLMEIPISNIHLGLGLDLSFSTEGQPQQEHLQGQVSKKACFQTLML